MESRTQKIQYKNRLSIAGLLLLFVPVSIYILWIMASSANPSATQAENVAIYLSYFPLFLRSIAATSVLLVISSIGAIVLSVSGRKRANKFFSVISLIVIIAASFLLFLQIFSLL
jgi:hypothetical protein